MGFDTETHGRENRFDMGVISTPVGDLLYEDAQEMLDALTHRDLWQCDVWATNLAFDAWALFQAVAGDGRLPPGWEIFDNGAKVIHVRHVTKNGNSVRYRYMLDSLNVYLAGVEKMGEVLKRVAANRREMGDPNWAYWNEGKLVKPPWLGKRRYRDLDDDEKFTHRTYCAADARITRKFIEWFQAEVNALGGQLRRTAASTALDLYQRRFMREEGFVIPQPGLESMIEAKLSYYGGRTEDLTKGHIIDLREYDVTSMYPASMLGTDFPYPSPESFVKHLEPPRAILRMEGFSHVTIEVPPMHVPPLPHRVGDKLLFPIGRLTGTWTNLELRHAEQVGCRIEAIHWTWATKHTFRPFDGYVRTLFAARMEHAKRKLATEEVIKLFLNGLYGKFGQNFMSQETADRYGIKIKQGGGTFVHVDDASEAEILWTAFHQPHYLAQGFAIRAAVASLKPFMNPILSSYTTSKARIKLHDYLTRACREVGDENVHYMDTDSIFTTGELSFATKEKVLGALQEKAHYREGWILGPKAKLLVMQDGTKVTTYKGVPEKDPLAPGRNPRLDLFSGVARGILKVRFHRFVKFKEAAARGLMPNEIVAVPKSFSPFDYTKRKIVGEDPWLRDLATRSFATEPWLVTETGALS